MEPILIASQKSTMNAHVLAFLSSVVLLLASSYACASTPDPEVVRAALEEAKARLKLTPEQEAQLKPVIEDRTIKLKAIKEKHAGDTSRSAKRAMFKEARPVMDDYQQKVRAILTGEQEAEWEKMRDEARTHLKEQYRSGIAPD